jgi:integrase
LLSRLKLIFKFAIPKGYYRDKNPAEWKDHLENTLPASKDVHRVAHHAALPYKDAGRFMVKLRAWEDGSLRQQGHTASALMLEFIVLSGVRVSEARLATWKEFDLRPEPDGMIWNVPPENRKTGHLHDEVRPIPITAPMLAVLKEMQKRRTDQSPDALVFQSPRGGRYDVNACWQLITKTLKWNPPITAHGFRTTFTHWANANGFAPRLINRQLDHVVGGKVLRAYDRDPSIDERRAMMRLWGEYCAQPAPEPATGTVSQFSEARKKRRKAS